MVLIVKKVDRKLEVRRRDFEMGEKMLREKGEELAGERMMRGV